MDSPPPSSDDPGTPGSPRLSIVTVNWNGGGEAVRNLTTLLALASRRDDLEIVVVDNGSIDGSLDELAKLEGTGSLRILRSGANLGFGPACNRGVAEARAPLVLLLNPDAVPFPDDDPFAPLLAAADASPAVAAFAPMLGDAEAPGRREAQGSFQLRRLPSLGSIAREMLLLDRLFPRSAARQRERYLDVDRTKPFDVEQPAAAALLLRRGTFLRLGGFDPRFVPAWWEDVDLCWRLRAAGESIRTVPESRFLHRGGSSIGEEEGRLGEREYRRIYGRNLLRFGNKHWGFFATVALRVLLLAAGSLRLLLALAGARGDRPRATTIDAALGTIRSAAARIGENRARS